MFAPRHLRTIVAALLGGAALVAVSSPARAAGDQREAVIVEFAGTPALRTRADDRNALKQRHDDVRSGQRAIVKAARSRGVELREQRAFSMLFNGISARIRQRDRAALARVPGVVAVHKDTTLHTSVSDSVPLTGAPEVWKRSDPSGRKVLGEGISVAVIDTGVDYSHPDLGGGWGPGHKVTSGYDFVNDDGDPMDDNAHGTHVAGIVAGEGHVRGVAPKATLQAYKVLDRRGNGYASDIIAGIEAAAQNRADVINMSLGGPGDGTDPVGRTATRAAQAGAVVVASAGNDGPGAQTVSTPAAADGVLAVAATTSGIRVPRLEVSKPGRQKVQAFRYRFSANPPRESKTAPLVDGRSGSPEDLAKLGDIKGKVVLVDGANGPADVDHGLEIEKRGALAVLYGGIGNAPVRAGSTQTGDQFAAGSGDDTRFDKLVALYADNLESEELRRFLGAGALSVKLKSQSADDELASFSSRGPSWRYGAKPDLAAPGVEIRSTVPKAILAHGEYRFSGTSMAAPHVAGAAALLRQLHPARPAAALGGQLTGSAKRLSGRNSLEQGAGRLDIPAAADNVLAASPATISFGLADLSGKTVGGTQPVRIANAGKRSVRARLSAPDGVRVRPSSVTVPPGRSVQAKVSIAARTPSADTDLTGWITVDGGRSSIRVPYALSVQHLRMYASPAPSDGTSEAFIYSPVPLAAPPVVTVTDPGGGVREVPARLDHGSWWRAPLTGTRPGTYRIAASGRADSTVGGVTLTARTAMEVTASDSHGVRWEPIGPNSSAGQSLTTFPSADSQLATALPGDAGVWLTSDRGRNWQQMRRLPVGQQTGGSGWLVADPKDARRMWYAVSGQDGTYQGKVLYTQDRGRSWTTLPFPDVAVDQLVSDGSTLVALTPNALYVSRDRGMTWQATAIPWTKRTTDIALVGDDLFASTFDGVWVIRDITGAEPKPGQRVFLPPRDWTTQIEGDKDMIITSTFFGAGDIFGSRDGGTTWEKVYTPRQTPQHLKLSGGDIFVGSYSENYVGRDHGKSWSVWKEPIKGAIESDFASWGSGDGPRLISSQRAGIFSTSDDGKSYTRIGVQAVTTHSLAMGRGQDGRDALIAGTDFDTYRTGLPAGTVNPEWGTAREAGVGTSIRQMATSPRDPKVLWKTRQTAIGTFAVSRSEDGGVTWKELAETKQVPYALHIDPADPGRVTISFWTLQGSGLFVTTNNGKTWRKLQHKETFEAIASDRSKRGRLWLGSRNGLFRSDDGGDTVTKVSDEPVSAIHTDQRVPKRLVIGGKRILVSTDGGRAFRPGEDGELPMRVSAIVAHPGNSQVLYAGAGSFSDAGLHNGGRGVLRSTDGGRTWANVSGTLQNLAVTSLAVSPDGKWLYAGATGGGVHRLRLG